MDLLMDYMTNPHAHKRTSKRIKTMATDNNTPAPCPKGFRPVRGGKVQNGDKIWTPETGSYTLADIKHEVGTPVTAWKTVIRPYGA